MSLVYEHLESLGMEFAAYNSKFASEKCFDLKEDYFYSQTSSTACTKNLYLKGATSYGEENAMGALYQNCNWGKAASAISVSPREDGIRYYSAFNGKDDNGQTVQVPFVYKNYGLAPIPGLSTYSLYPFTAQQVFTYSDGEIFLWYYKKGDKCVYATSPQGPWHDLNDGPGVFFIMVGGGGSGANGTLVSAGGGGGGGGSMMGYMDLRNMGSFVKVTFGKGGVYPTSTSSGAKGNPGGATCLSRTTGSVIAEDGTRKYSYALVALSAGGDGGGTSSYSATKGQGGRVKYDYDDFGTKFLRIFDGWQGCDGGTGSMTSSVADGESYPTDTKFNLTFFDTNYRPTIKNTYYGNGSSAYKANATDTAYGGGGGASFLSKPSGTTSGGYGCGGYGGSYKSGEYWATGGSGTDGALLIMKLE